MSKFILLSLSATFLFHSPVYAKPKVVKIYSVDKTKMDGVFTLENSSEDTALILDCNSFIHNLKVKGPENSHTYYLNLKECKDYLDQLKNLSKVSRCLHYDKKEHHIDDCALKKKPQQAIKKAKENLGLKK